MQVKVLAFTRSSKPTLLAAAVRLELAADSARCDLCWAEMWAALWRSLYILWRTTGRAEQTREGTER
jgi:hypothetical protein